MCTQKLWREEPASVMGEPSEKPSQQTNEKDKNQTLEKIQGHLEFLWKRSEPLEKKWYYMIK